MLALTVRAGDYITIGDDVVIQILKVGDLWEVPIERGKVREQNADAPECIKRLRKKYGENN